MPMATRRPKGPRGHRPAKGEPKGAKSLSERAKGELKDTYKGALIAFREAPKGPFAKYGKPLGRQAHF